MMEKYLNNILVISIVVASVAFLILVVYGFFYFRSKYLASMVLQNGRRSDDFIYRLIATTFPKRNIIKNAIIPASQNPDNTRFTPVDIICVNHGGIAVIEVKRQSGKIDNPMHGDWVQMADNNVVRMVNPMEENAFRMRAVEQIIKREKLYNIPLHNYVVFTNKNTTFRNAYSSLLTPEKLIVVLQDMNKNRFLTSSEISQSVSAIRKHMKHRSRPVQNVNN